MKYLHKFESYRKYTLRIDTYELRKLMDNAVDKRQYSTISDILDSNYSFLFFN